MASSTSSLSPEEVHLSSPSSDTLVTHLLAAKRSLSCVEQVYRANDLVNTTRQALESHTITTARIIFLQHGCQAQVQILDRVQEQNRSIAQEADKEFQTVISDLDAADNKLKKTLEQLRATIIESSLRSEGEPEKSLADFLDESGVQNLLGTIKEGINTTQAARTSYEQSNRGLEAEVANIRNLLGLKAGKMAFVEAEDRLRSPIPDLLQGMENRAQEMADNLESLVRHFDACVTAIKHTEGGGAAVQKITSDMPDQLELGLDRSDTSLEPMSEQERKDMLTVLEKDASEVEEVVMDIRERSAEIEADFERVNDHSDQLADELARNNKAFKLLEEVGNKLPSYMTQSHIFLMRWDEEKAKIEEGMSELDSLCHFYDGFLHAYDNLIVEVGRRKAMEKRMAKVAQDASTKIEALRAEEVAEREAFRLEQGDFLPVDIWPGLMTAPTQYTLSQPDGGTGNVPDISASVIQKAIRRVSRRQDSAAASR